MNLKLIFEIKRILFYLSLLAQLVLLYFNLTAWRNGLLGCVLFAIYLLLVGAWWQKIFRKIFNMKEHDIITKILSFFAVFLLLSFGSSIFVVWYKITPVIIYAVYIMTALLSFVLHILTEKHKHHLPGVLNMWQFKQSFSKDFFIKNYFFLIPIYVILWGVDIFFLWQNTGNDAANSPWQIIDKTYLPIFFLLTLLLGVIIFSQHKVKTVLLCVMMHSVLVHLYLPVSHVLPWGGDVWRHIAVEQKLTNGEFNLPVLIGSEAKWREVAGIDLPEALIIPNKYMYGQLWGITVLLSQTLQINLIFINKWLLPILWSIIFPLILFRVGKILFGSWRSGLVLAAATGIFFPFQVLGAISLPVSLGYLTFFFVLMFWFQYIRDEAPWQRYITVIFAVLMVFGYTVHFLFIWLIFVLTYLYRKMANLNINIKNKLMYPLALVSVLVFPVLELFARTSRLPTQFNFVFQAKQLVGQFTGWYFASGIRPHDILSGNIIFNHTPSFAFVSSLFMDWRWPIILFMILIWLFVSCALFFDKKNDIQSEWIILKLFSLSVISGYIIGWFVLEGDRSFIRRFDGMFAFCILIFFVYGLIMILNKKFFRFYSRVIVLFLCFGFAWLSSVTYASGPDMRVLSQNEYDAAYYISQKIDTKEVNHCVLADTWVLLALEGVSGQKIVGGGFPIDYQFAQNERQSFYNEIQSGEHDDILLRLHKTTNSDKCFVVLPKNIITPDKYEFMQNMTGSDGVAKGEFFVWEEKTTSTVQILKNS